MCKLKYPITNIAYLCKQNAFNKNIVYEMRFSMVVCFIFLRDDRMQTLNCNIMETVVTIKIIQLCFKISVLNKIE